MAYQEQESKWLSKHISELDARFLSNALNKPLAFCKLLVSLGIKNPIEASQFLNPNYRLHLHNPFLMKDMLVGVERINEAIEKGERILGHGDYDCDGVTTTTLMKKGFELLGVEIDIYAPNRYSDGYGLNPKNMDKFARDYDVIISGDTGIRAFESAKLIKDIGRADLVITDHHEPLEGKLQDFFKDFVEKIVEGNTKFNQNNPASNSDELVSKFHSLTNEEKITLLKNDNFLPKDSIVEIIDDEFIALPDACAVIDAQRLGDPYPCKTLAGVGHVFKLLQALFTYRKVDQKPLLYLLDLVATGTIADLAQQIDRKGSHLDFEVRTSCRYGLEIMNKKPKTWVKAIRKATSIKDDKTIDSTTIGFGIGPLLNAPGRVEGEGPGKAVDLLLEEDEEKALEMAKELKKINSERQKQTKAYEKIIEELKQEGDERFDYGIAVQSDAYAIGIAGLVAGKLCQKFYRPAIALAPVEKDGKVILKGSARSIPGIHVLRMLDKVKNKIGHFEYGGHEQAAGMSLEPERFNDFMVAFREACMNNDPECFVPVIYYDIDVSLSEITDELLEDLDRLEPFGEGNPKPIFHSSRLKIIELKPIMENKGAIIQFEQNGHVVKGIIFSNGEVIINSYEEALEKGNDCFVDILYSPEFNYFNGRNIQLMLQDIKFI